MGVLDGDGSWPDVSGAWQPRIFYVPPNTCPAVPAGCRERIVFLHGRAAGSPVCLVKRNLAICTLWITYFYGDVRIRTLVVLPTGCRMRICKVYTVRTHTLTRTKQKAGRNDRSGPCHCANGRPAIKLKRFTLCGKTLLSVHGRPFVW